MVVYQLGKYILMNMKRVYYKAVHILKYLVICGDRYQWISIKSEQHWISIFLCYALVCVMF